MKISNLDVKVKRNNKSHDLSDLPRRPELAGVWKLKNDSETTDEFFIVVPCADGDHAPLDNVVLHLQGKRLQYIELYPSELWDKARRDQRLNIGMPKGRDLRRAEVVRADVELTLTFKNSA